VASLVKSGATTKDEFTAGLRSLRIVQTVLGPIAFDSNRDVKAAPVVLKIVKDGFAYLQ
jgi:ABC-type branched-subunit amino acid transport system substrate-binding protein